MDGRNKKWYTDGTVDIKLFDTDDIPEGFYRGRTKSPILGKSIYNNGVDKKYFKDTDVIPEGWVKGDLPKTEEHQLKINAKLKGRTFSDAHRANISNANLKRFSDKTNHPMYGKHLSEDTKIKISNTKSGVSSPVKGVKYTDEQKQKRINTIIDKYGSLDVFNIMTHGKMTETKLNRYGDANYNNREKAKTTIDSNPNFYPQRQLNTERTLIKKYGSLDNAYAHRANSKLVNSDFDSFEDYYKNWRDNIIKPASKHSSLEEVVRDKLISLGLTFESPYLIRKNDVRHEFDFAIFNGGKLIYLIDCDGLYYHGYLSDVNGKSVNNYSDSYRMLLIPEGVKFSVILESSVDVGIAELLSNINLTEDEYVLKIFNWCREEGFPYPAYKEKILHNSMSSLVKSDPSKFSENSRYGDKLIQHFHPSIWHANKHNKLSPFNAWNDDNTLMKAIKNRIVYKGNNLDRSRVLAGLSASGIAPKVSTFNPYMAKFIINKYANEFDTIFDPCSGYSGRMLGAASLGKHYIGQDVNPVTIQESNDLINFLSLDAEISVADSLLNDGKYDCLFTCTPYGNKENWGQALVDMSCDEWIDALMQKYKCKKYLFVVDNTNKYKSFIKEEFHFKSHFTTSCEYLVVIERSDVEDEEEIS